MATPKTAVVSAIDLAQRYSLVISGKTILITGGTLGGIGTEFASILAKHSPKLIILTARTQAKIEESFDFIRKDTPDAPLRGVLLDLSSLKDVRRASAEINSYQETIDVLVHNAGVAGLPLTRSDDGLEMHFATNHIGPFLMTKLLLPKMLESPAPPRLVIVSSGANAHCQGFHWADPNYLKDKYSDTVYGESKVLNCLFASALARKSHGKIEAFSVSPGWIASQLSRHLSLEKKREMGFLKDDGSFSDALGSLQAGCISYLVAAFDPDLPKSALGQFIGSQGIASPEKVAEFAKGIDLEEKMWTLSESTIGEKFEM